MRAAIIAGPRHIEFTTVDLPDPPAGHVRIRIEGCGICGSNLPVWLGRPWFDYPLPPGSPGHEAWGRVDAVGDGVTGVRVGDRVATLSSEAFAESTLTEARSVVVLPPSLDDRAFPGEPLACAVNVFKRSHVVPGQRVAVVGVGFLGALVTRLAVLAGAEVTALSRRPFALDVARQYGAARVATLYATGDLGAEKHKYDCVIEAVGEQEALDVAAHLVRVRGRLVIAGYHQDGLRRIDLQDWNWRGLDVANAHERNHDVYVEGLRAAVELVNEGALDLAPILTHSLPLDRLADGFELLETRPAGFMKAMVAA